MSKVNKKEKEMVLPVPPVRPKSFREKVFRVLTVPFFLLGLCWFWVHKSFTEGYWAEQEEMDKYDW